MGGERVGWIFADYSWPTEQVGGVSQPLAFLMSPRGEPSLLQLLFLRRHCLLSLRHSSSPSTVAKNKTDDARFQGLRAIVAQLVRAPVCGTGGRRFEPTQLYHSSNSHRGSRCQGGHGTFRGTFHISASPACASPVPYP